MAKFNFVFALALFAFSLQASNGASFHNPNNNILRELISGQDMQHVVDEVNKLIIDVSGGLSSILLSLSDKYNDFKTESNLPAVVDQLKQDITVLTEDSSVSEICNSAAWYEVQQVEKLVQDATFSCKFSLDEDEKTIELHHQLSALIAQLQGFLQRINKAVFVCFRESKSSMDKFAQCMRSTVVDVQLQLKDVEVVATKALNALQNLVPELEDKVEECVQLAKKQVEDKAQIVIDDLKQCSQVETPVSLRMLCWPNVDIPICNDYDWDF